MSKNFLIISNNIFSEHKNNGKTLFSFFDNHQRDRISQLYFSEEHIEINDISYFNLTDKMMIKKGETTRYMSSNTITQSFKSSRYEEHINKIKEKIIKSNFSRLAREFFWKKSKWYENDLNQWINKNKPDIIFFCAGDSGFAYDIVENIVEKHNLKLITYITDDYVLNRKTLNIFWHIRRMYILKKFKDIRRLTNQYFTISPKMKKKYKEVFNIDSEILSNISSDKKYLEMPQKKIPKRLVYAGGLHYGRESIIIELSNIIEKINENRSEENYIYLDIYSHQKITKKFIKSLEKMKYSNFLGMINKSDLEIKLQEDIMPVHVESFKLRHKEATRLSLSTKIPEYLSLGKPSLVIGPQDISSIEYLKEVSYCINDSKLIEETLKMIFEDISLYNQKCNLVNELYFKNHNKQTVLKKLDEVFKKI